MAGDSVVVVVVLVPVPVVASGEVAVLGLAAGVTVSVFCSQAASNAALARMQMYFFIVVLRDTLTIVESRQADFSALVFLA